MAMRAGSPMLRAALLGVWRSGWGFGSRSSIWRSSRCPGPSGRPARSSGTVGFALAGAGRGMLAHRWFGAEHVRAAMMSDGARGLAPRRLPARARGDGRLSFRSFVDRRPRSYARLADFTLGYLRFCLAAIVFHYGFIKVLGGQFTHPDPSSLIQPLGQRRRWCCSGTRWAPRRSTRRSAV